MKYEVFVTQTGYIEVEADDEDAAIDKVACMTGEDVSWSDEWMIDAVQEQIASCLVGDPPTIDGAVGEYVVDLSVSLFGDDDDDDDWEYCSAVNCSNNYHGECAAIDGVCDKLDPSNRPDDETIIS